MLNRLQRLARLLPDHNSRKKALLALIAPTMATQAPAAANLWPFPLVVGASLAIAWGAEAAQFLISQGLALALVAWLQTLPEFAVEFVIAWQLKVDLMMANLAGAIRLLVGLGWPLIYATAAFFHRHRFGKPLRVIRLEKEHAIEVLFLAPPLAYFFFIWAKARLELYDAFLLILMYVAYMLVLQRIPPQAEEKIEHLPAIPRLVLGRPRRERNVWIALLFLGGGVTLYFAAEPFLHSMLVTAVWLGVPSFVFVQWVAPFLSEFPEKVSAFYWARTIHNAAMAMMNMVSSNINQWTLLAAMLPIVYSISLHRHGLPVIAIHFDALQEVEIMLTIAQSLLGLLLLANLEFHWKEALAIFVLWFVQFVTSTLPHHLLMATPSNALVGWLQLAAIHMAWLTTLVYLLWSGGKVFEMTRRRHLWIAVPTFVELWRTHVKGSRRP